MRKSVIVVDLDAVLARQRKPSFSTSVYRAAVRSFFGVPETEVTGIIDSVEERLSAPIGQFLPSDVLPTLLRYFSPLDEGGRASLDACLLQSAARSSGLFLPNLLDYVRDAKGNVGVAFITDCPLAHAVTYLQGQGHTDGASLYPMSSVTPSPELPQSLQVRGSAAMIEQGPQLVVQDYGDILRNIADAQRAHLSDFVVVGEDYSDTLRVPLQIGGRAILLSSNGVGPSVPVGKYPGRLHVVPNLTQAMDTIRTIIYS
jgi:hypothetical protein